MINITGTVNSHKSADGNGTLKHPFISIITCTRNSGEYLSDCIESVEKQTFTDIEHIFIDAFSSDTTLQLIKEYQNRNKIRVKLFQYPSKGIANAMNLGILHSSGDVIEHLQGDDYLYSADVLREVYDIFRKNISASIVVGNGLIRRNAEYISDWPENRIKRYFHHMFIKSYFMTDSRFSHPATFIKRRVFDKWGLFDETYSIAIEYDLFLRVIKKEKYILVNKNFSVYRDHDRTASSNTELRVAEVDRAAKAHKNEYRFERALNTLIIFPFEKFKRVLNRLLNVISRAK